MNTRTHERAEILVAHVAVFCPNETAVTRLLQAAAIVARCRVGASLTHVFDRVPSHLARHWACAPAQQKATKQGETAHQKCVVSHGPASRSVSPTFATR